jgi:hypothetical protein
MLSAARTTVPSGRTRRRAICYPPHIELAGASTRLTKPSMAASSTIQEFSEP